MSKPILEPTITLGALDALLYQESGVIAPADVPLFMEVACSEATCPTQEAADWLDLFEKELTKQIGDEQ